MNGNDPTVSFKEAQQIIVDTVTPLGSEMLSILDCPGRFLYKDIISDIMSPPFDNSSMDGYAVIAEDTRGATKQNPVKLNVIGEVQAGGHNIKKVTKGNAVRIMTGAPMPGGADSVIQIEDTGEENNTVRIYREISIHENYRFMGDDINKGDMVLQKGDKLSSADIGLLSTLNLGRIEVYKQPKVSILTTGDEIVDIGEEIKSGQIRNSNSYTLYSEVKKYGGIPKYLGVAKDTIKETKAKFMEALEGDVIISTGGVSMGKYDFVKEIYRELGIDINFKWINVKPGRPCVFGTKGKKIFFGLPGNPVSTMTSFIEFVRPAILKLMGANKINKPVISAVLEEDITKNTSKLHLIRGIFTTRNNELYVSTTGLQGSNILSSMSKANCLIIIPEDIQEIKAGNKVLIQLIDHDEVL